MFNRIPKSEREYTPPDLPSVPSVYAYAAVAIFLLSVGTSLMTPWNDTGFAFILTGSFILYQIVTNG